LARTPRNYATTNYHLLAAWSIGFVFLASSIGYMAGTRRVRLLCRALFRLTPIEPHASAWWLLFNEHPDAVVYVGCFLDNGSYISGRLHSYSRDAREDRHHELTLRGSITYVPPEGSGRAEALTNVGAVAINSRNVTLMTVSYVPQ
jgi:Family of unknown function (DUF6338)